ncbi:MAG TPA: DMT family transporter [Coleofasciculaceae cyanobacterium]|jgi:transporter family-2 protein
MTLISFSRLQAITSRCQICLYLGLSLLSGAVLPIQASLNAQLARSLHSVPLAATISYFVGAIALIGLLATGQFGYLNWSGLWKAPRWSFLGGLLGAWYIASSAYFVSVLGTTSTLGFVVFGQTIAGMTVDHFGWLGVNRRQLTRNRRFAVGLLVVAMFFLSIQT